MNSKLLVVAKNLQKILLKSKNQLFFNKHYLRIFIILNFRNKSEIAF